MKRIVLLVTLAALVGCSPDEQAKERADAKSDFDSAYEHLAAATAGYITNTSFTGTLEDFQSQQLEQASAKLTPIIRNGSDDQQVAASVALAAVESARARRIAQRATIDWAKQSAIGKEMIATLTGAKKAQTLVDAHRALDSSGQLRSANQELATAQQELREADATIRAKQAEIKRRTDRRNQLEKERLAKATKAADLRGRAFESTGQLRFDLHTQASDLTREADRLGVERDKEAMEINRLSAELAIAEIEKRQAEQRIESMQAIIDGYDSRKEKLGMSVDEAAALADQLATDLVNQIKQRAEQHTAEVADPFTQAGEHYAKAIDTLQKARAVADADSRPAVATDLAGLQSELGFITREEAIAHQAYADLLSVIAEQTSSAFPKPQAATIGTMTEDAVRRAAEAKAEAVDALNTASDLLTDAGDAIRGNEEARKLVLRQQVGVLNTIAEMTGELSARQKANGAAAELRELESE